ncbi:MAG TPA: lysylphosphatidylglycerol synthase domain-containing protein [Burkholderiaceae bacterium]|nr:lysylphosphatidylglycerol synthase domain-containing protein [Burkholderiaceae bacterium]
MKARAQEADEGANRRQPARDSSDAPDAPPSLKRRAWTAVRRFGPWVLSLVVLALIISRIRTIEWPAVWQALLAQPPGGLAIAVALGLLSYLTFSSYDLIGRRVTGHGVPVWRTLRIAAVCYAFNLNFGSLVGALAMKLRMYGRAGLETATTLRVIGLSVLTNWLGYLALGAAVLLVAPPPLPNDWPQQEAFTRVLGAAMAVPVVAYLVWCARGRESARTLTWRGHALTLPGARLALWQVVTASANWALMGAIVWVLLPQQVAFPTALGVLLIAAIAGVATHVPAGLGVIEAVFLVCLQGQVAQGPLLAALLAYRASYYLLPLIFALIGFAVHERGGEDRAGAMAGKGAGAA